MNINFSTRQLIRSCSRGFLATDFNTKNFKKKISGINVFPYATFTLTAFDYDLSPIILLSDLSEHTKNLRFNENASIILCEEQKMYNYFPKFFNKLKKVSNYEDPMSRPRITLIGKFNITKESQDRERFLYRHPASRLYEGFKDMNFFKMKIKSAHLVGGFANVKWFDHTELLCKNFKNFKNLEKQIIEHMNSCHQESINAYTKKFLPYISGNKNNWKLVGIDPDGFDLRKKDKLARIAFEKGINNAKKLRGIFVSLNKLATKN